MRRQTTDSEFDRLLDGFAALFDDWRFPVFIISTLLFFWLMVVGFLTIPTGDSGVSAFARDFRTWCFNYDPATGQMDWFYVGVMLSKPLFLAGIVALIWWEQLGIAWRRVGSELALVAGLALVGVGLVGISFVFVGEPDPTIDGDYPFPAERLRTAIEPPDFELPDQTGEKLSLDDLEGDVVVVTAVYATCWDSCPVILSELRGVTDQFESHHDDLTVVGITLDPDNDGPEELTALADRHGVEPPLYRLLHGEHDEVNRVLDEFSVSRQLDEQRGEIDHANLFIVIDRSGDIAYRITLGDRTEPWLSRAIELLLDEGVEEAARTDGRSWTSPDELEASR